MPGPAVDVKARAPAQEAPSTMPMAASSSSACRIAKLFFLVSGSLRYFSQNALNASITDVAGVMGYQAATVAPAYTHPSAVAVLPSMRILSAFAFMGATRNGSGQSRRGFSHPQPRGQAPRTESGKALLAPCFFPQRD